MPCAYHIAANRYRPERVRVLFIAESPPACLPGSPESFFFFEENPGGDILFATIVQAVLDIRYRIGNDVPKRDILRSFKANEYWLMDAVEYPINRIDGNRTSDSIRKGYIIRGIANLLARISTLRAENGDTNFTIVLIKNLVYECLAQPLRQSDYSVPQVGPIGFPRYYGDPATIEGIRSAIPNQHFV
jgi:hypothetical protein